MLLTTIDPTDGVYPSTTNYAHGISVQGAKRLVYLSGTMGLETDGRPGDGLERQLDLVWTNIRCLLAEAGMSTDNIVRITSYLADPSQAEVNAKARVAALGGRLVPTTAIIVQTLKPDWLIEIEVVAAE